MTFSAEGQRLLGLGQLSIMNGQRPLLVDSAGKIVEIGRITPNIALVAASVTSLVVATAHLIATRDLIQRIELLQHNVNWLIKARQIDQWATFERIFYAAREICARPIDETARMELWRMRQELREQRIRLRREWQAKLAEIKIEPLWVDQLPPNVVEGILRNPLIRKMYDDALVRE
ncbi:hypothetical protein [uncultured Chloroflexus sp.]|nr:hypothetical protein [uncultured Chloroflexus sp.]